MPNVYPENQQTKINGENVTVDDKGIAYVLRKTFFSIIVVLLLILLFVCFYRFLYTKLRCIHRRFNNSDSRKCCLSKQKYGTTSNPDLSVKKTRRTWTSIHGFANSLGKTIKDREFGELKNYECSTIFSSANESNEQTFSSTSEEARVLLLKLTDEAANKLSSTDNFLSNSEMEYFRSEASDEKIYPGELGDENSMHNRVRNALTRPEIPFHFQSEKIILWERCTGKESKRINVNGFERASIRSLRDVQSRFPRSTISQISVSTQTKYNVKETRKSNFNSNQSKMINFENDGSDWICCSCNELSESRTKTSLPPNSIVLSRKPKNSNLQEQTIPQLVTNNNFNNSRCEGESEMSDTYDELGMMISEQMKRQWRPCRRKYCPLTRKLRGSEKVPEHDVTKYRARVRSSFGCSVIKFDERPAGSSAEICRDTYDEFELMGATRDKRDDVARSIINRRKRFLDRACLSPIRQTIFFDK